MNRIPIVLMLLLVSIIGCRTKSELPVRTNPKLGVTETVANMKAAMPTFEWAVLRFTADYTGIDKKKFFVGGQMRIRSDSAIWVSLSAALGLEAARAIISYDSLKLINRLQSSYFIGDLSMLSKIMMTSLDFDILQALLMGNDIAFYEDSVFNLTPSPRQIHLSTPGRHKLSKHLKVNETNPAILVQDIWLDPETYRIRRQQLKIIGQEQQKVEVNYSDFRMVNGKLVPHNVDLKISVNGDVLVNMAIIKIEFDVPQSMPFNIPASFKPIR